MYIIIQIQIQNIQIIIYFNIFSIPTVYGIYPDARPPAEVHFVSQ